MSASSFAGRALRSLVVARGWKGVRSKTGRNRASSPCPFLIFVVAQQLLAVKIESVVRYRESESSSKWSWRAEFPAISLLIPWSIANRSCLCGLPVKTFSAGKISLLFSLSRELLARHFIST